MILWDFFIEKCGGQKNLARTCIELYCMTIFLTDVIVKQFSKRIMAQVFQYKWFSILKIRMSLLGISGCNRKRIHRKYAINWHTLIFTHLFLNRIQMFFICPKKIAHSFCQHLFTGAFCTKEWARLLGSRCNHRWGSLKQVAGYRECPCLNLCTRSSDRILNYLNNCTELYL